MSDPIQDGSRVSGSSPACIGRWTFSLIPDGWEFAPEFGIRKLEGGRQVANIRLSEDILPAGKLLAPYLVAQTMLFGRTFANPKIAGPSVITFAGTEEAALLFLKHGQLEDAPAVIQSQTYVRIGRWIGIITLTATARSFPSLKANYQSFAARLQVATQQI
jgi:hypothetical protein